MNVRLFLSHYMGVVYHMDDFHCKVEKLGHTNIFF